MCDCYGLGRAFDEAQHKGISPSAHHPKCEDYALIEYAEIKQLEGGKSLVVEKHEVNDVMENWGDWGESKDDFKVEPIFLTLDQFESMQEFDGF